MSAPLINFPAMAAQWADEALRPPEEVTPAEFAKKNRVLHRVYCSENPGPWDDQKFPWQNQVMDAAQEAVRDGRRGVVLMKAGQIGGTDCMINAGFWLKVYLPGPQLFLTSTEGVAGEFGRERYANIIPDMAPLKKTYIPNPRGGILTKRFVDGKIQLCGGKSVFKLQSTPYRVIILDEIDSLAENLGKEGDPLKLAEIRLDSFDGQTLILAYAHPTTSDRGAARIFFKLSDQRRGFVTHKCGHEFYLQWQHVRATPVGGESQADAEQNPDCYHYHCPGCDAAITDAERTAMLRQTLVYKSTLPPEIARRKAWIGLHASQLYTPAKSIRSFAARWIDCAGDENAIRVFWNKILGEPYEPKVQKVDLSAFQSLIVVKRRANDPEFYLRGQVPPGVVFLTGGQDSRNAQLHFAIWGWGLRRCTNKTLAMCGWLIEYGIIDRTPATGVFTEADYHVFDDLIYRRKFFSTCGRRHFNVACCGHDIGYSATQIAIVQYCRNFPRRAIPVRGAAMTATSSCKAPFAAWGSAIKYKAGEVEVSDDASRCLNLNTYMLKTEFFGWTHPDRRIEVPEILDGQTVGVRRVAQLVLPEDVDDNFMESSKNEALEKGKKKNELVWMKTNPNNHFADCNTYALGLAHELDPFLKNRTADENPSPQRRMIPAGGGDRGGGGRERFDPAMG